MSSSGGGWSDETSTDDAGRVDALTPRRYDDLGPLGRGGMGEVVRCYDAHLQRHVARKRLRPDRAHDDARLLREARLTAALDHPGIVSAFDVGTDDDGALFYTMRLVAGRTLGEAAPSLSLAERLRHLLSAARAVAFAHHQGVVHRDLKPDNIMVGPYGQTQVVDWGLALHLDEPQTGQIVGTARFRSPEQERGEPIDASTDVHALGVTLADLLGTDAPPELAAVVQRATGERAERYPDASAFADDLAAYLDGRVVGAHAYSPWQRLGRWLHRYRWPLGVAAALAVGAGVVGAFAAVEIVAERDRALAAEAVADDVLSRSLARQAVAAVRAGRRGEAEVLAEHAAALAHRPRATGARMAFAALPPPAFDARPAPCDGRYRLGATGEGCTDGEVDERPEAGGSWTSDGGEVVWRPDHGPAERHAFHHTRLRTHGDRALAWNPSEARRFGPGGTQAVVAPCELLPASALTADDAWLLCPDGRAVRLHEGGVDTVPLEGLGEGDRAMAWAGGHLLVSDGERVLAFGADGRLRWSLPTGLGTVRSLRGQPGGDWVWVEGVQPGGRFVDAARGQLGITLDALWQGAGWRDGQLVHWRDGVRHAVGPTDVPTVVLDAGIAHAVLSDDGGQLAMGTGSGRVVLVDRDQRRRLDHLLGEGVVKWLAFDDRALWVSHPSDPLPHRFDRRDGTPWPRLDARPYETHCKRLLVLDGLGHCAVYGRQLLWRLSPHEEPRASPDRLVDADQGVGVGVTLSEQGEVRRVRAGRDDEVLGRWPDVHRIATDATGERLLLARTDGQLSVLGSRGIGLQWTGPTGLRDVALSPDGSLAVTGHFDGIARVWSADDGRLLAVLEGVHDDQVATVDIVADSVLTAGWDGRVHRWGLGPLTRDPEPAEVEARWGRTLDELVGSQGSP